MSPLFLFLSVSFSDCLPTYLPTYPPIYPCIHLSIPLCLSVYLSISSVYQPIYLSIYLISLSIYLPIYLSGYRSIDLSIYLSHLSTNLSTYPPIDQKNCNTPILLEPKQGTYTSWFMRVRVPNHPSWTVGDLGHCPLWDTTQQPLLLMNVLELLRNPLSSDVVLQLRLPMLWYRCQRYSAWCRF